MSMREMQLAELKNFLKDDFELNEWKELVIASPDTSDTYVIRIKKVGQLTIMDDNSVIKSLLQYFNQIEMDSNLSKNHTCKIGCCDCCTNDFEISITEFFMILDYLGINYGKDFVARMSKRAKMSFNAEQCIFVDNTNGACSIYEVRPLVCRKYGLYRSIINCGKLDQEVELLNKRISTEVNTMVFKHSKSSKSIMIPIKRICYWFDKIENGELKSEKMKKLFYASINNSADSFFELLIT